MKIKVLADPVSGENPLRGSQMAVVSPCPPTAEIREHKLSCLFL